MAHVKESDLRFHDGPSGGLTALLTHRKGAKLRPLYLAYPANPDWGDAAGPPALLHRWRSLRPPSEGFFNVRAGTPLGAADLALGVSRALALVRTTAPDGFYYGSQSPRIGGFNELLNLQYTREWVMTRMDWGSEMFMVYFDSRIVLISLSGWFFGHLRRAPQPTPPP